MKDLITKVFEEKMQDGSIEKIISDRIDEMIKQICSDQMNWNGPAKKAMEERLSPLIIQAVEASDLSSMVTKITTLINTALSGSELEKYHDVLASVRSLFGVNDDLREKKVIKLSEIFKKYQEYLQDIYDRDDFDEMDIDICEGDETATISCSLRVAAEENYFSWREPGYIVELSTDKSNVGRSGDLRFKVWPNYDNTKYHLWGDFRSMSLRELQNCPEFILYLGALERYDVDIEIDTKYEDDVVAIDCKQY